MMEAQYDVEINPVNCKECGYCMEVCTNNIFRKSNTVNAQGFLPMMVENLEDCEGCIKCMMVCPDFAITVKTAIEKN